MEIKSRKDIVDYSIKLFNRFKPIETDKIDDLVNKLIPLISEIVLTNNHNVIKKKLNKMIKLIKYYTDVIDIDKIYYYTDVYTTKEGYGVSKKYLKEVKYNLFKDISFLISSDANLYNFYNLPLSNMLYNIGRLNLIIEKEK